MSINYPLEEIILPMGGTTVKDLEKMDEIWESDDYIAEEKYDGSRYLSVGGRFFSRKVSVKTNFPVEKTDNVPHLVAILDRYPLLILDGEIYIEGAKSNQVVSIMGAKPEKALARQALQGNVSYVVYDILRDVDGNWLTNLPWIDRRGVLEEQLEMVFNDNFIAENDITLSDYVTTDKKEFNARIMRRGGEGVMLKNKNGTYHPDKKPRWNWIKVKQEITSDVIITGFKPAVREYKPQREELFLTWQYYETSNGNLIMLDGEGGVMDYKLTHGISVEPVSKFYFHGWIGAVEFSQYNAKGAVNELGELVDLVQVGYCSGIKEKLRKDMTDDKELYLGECMEISAMERTKDGYFRHPQFLRMRPDKNQKDCVIGED